jgi:hypothetical protein
MCYMTHATVTQPFFYTVAQSFLDSVSHYSTTIFFISLAIFKILWFTKVLSYFCYSNLNTFLDPRHTLQ